MTPAIIFYVVVLGLTAVAIYVQVTASYLSLPIPQPTSILVILLPWIAAAINFCTRLTNTTTPTNKRLSRYHAAAARAPIIRLARAALPMLQVFQGILTVVLATLLSQTMTQNGPTTGCLAQGTWQGMWSAHDRRGIERIQDAFDCCGLNSVKDRAWPRDGTCSSLYGRNSACGKPWEAALRRGSALDFGVCLVLGFIQLWQVSRFFLSRGGGAWAELGRGDGGSNGYRQLPPPNENTQTAEDSRLLEDVSDNEEEDIYRAPEHGGERVNDQTRLAGNQNSRGDSYGAVENGGTSAVVVPTGLGHEANAWR
ncbi:uncharacterized protein B0I36DRAFT_333761 [Microdochium trichocladiopsis]|uniref:Tetraspanin Tsp3 n=1 Tax=Microdochium trichocladiopsis TaxID=1682393 RepID=A0A9P8XV79_9PEZI|nr:uncharacterized protein B0I36DRAFT_333761 [Microdochium trichocladiopsis]KAH7021091.1 hypothetical protein B0I36DRAFT_333761 [Microdochium trichocladiopsis]